MFGDWWVEGHRGLYGRAGVRPAGISDSAWFATLNPLTFGINMLLKGRAHWLYDVSKLTASTVRGCIVPTPGNKLVVADYSNVEVPERSGAGERCEG